jgi:hypothetical protein
MSNRTIIEINHDYAAAIERSPVEFVAQLSAALTSGAERDWAPLWRFGVTRVTQCHHSDDRKLVVSNGAGAREVAIG